MTVVIRCGGSSYPAFAALCADSLQDLHGPGVLGLRPPKSTRIFRSAFLSFSLCGTVCVVSKWNRRWGCYVRDQLQSNVRRKYDASKLLNTRLLVDFAETQLELMPSVL